MPASCPIIEGITLDCRDSAGGIVEFYATEFENVTSVTSSSGTTTVITKASGKKFYTFKLEAEDATFTDVATSTRLNGTSFATQTLTFSMFKMSAKNRNILRLLLLNNLMIIVKDSNGVYHLMGETRGAAVTTGNGSSGKAMGDKNGYDVTIVANEPQLSNKVDSTIIAALLV